jgi:hypothetical protein
MILNFALKQHQKKSFAFCLFLPGFQLTPREKNIA